MTDAGQLALDTGDEQLDRMVGVTTVLGHTVWPGDGLLRWAWKQGRRNILLTEAGSTDARAAGSELHALHERLVDGQPPAPVQTLRAAVRGLAESLYAYWWDARPQVILTEVTLAHPALRFRGRIDYFRACPGCEQCAEDAVRGVHAGDLKTGAQPGSPPDARAARQVGGAYRLMFEDHPEQLPEAIRHRAWCGAEVLRVHADGSPATAWPVGDRRHGFRVSLESYREMEAHGDLPEKTL